jgi:tetratricopeptide (TPR) repeat protein
LKAELQLDPNNVDTQYNLAFVLLQQSRPEEAVGWLEKVVAQNPDHAQGNYELGKYLLGEGKTSAAAKYLETAARLSPELAHIHYQLQAAYRALGRQADADRELQVYRQLKEKSRNPNSPGMKPCPLLGTESSGPSWPWHSLGQHLHKEGTMSRLRLPPESRAWSAAAAPSRNWKMSPRGLESAFLTCLPRKRNTSWSR